MSTQFAPLLLRAETDFFARARRLYHPLFTCWYLFEDGEPRATAVVGKKVSSRAIDRNRLKRQMREVFSALEAPDHLQLVVVLKPKSLNISSAELRTGLNKVLQKITHEVFNPNAH